MNIDNTTYILTHIKTAGLAGLLCGFAPLSVGELSQGEVRRGAAFILTIGVGVANGVLLQVKLALGKAAQGRKQLEGSFISIIGQSGAVPAHPYSRRHYVVSN